MGVDVYTTQRGAEPDLAAKQRVVRRLVVAARRARPPATPAETQLALQRLGLHDIALDMATEQVTS
jgi:hypothetical protein